MQFIELDFREYLDMYDGVRSEVLCATKFDEKSDLSTTY